MLYIPYMSDYYVMQWLKIVFYGPSVLMGVSNLGDMLVSASEQIKLCNIDKKNN